jgi:hypothetical protein
MKNIVGWELDDLPNLAMKRLSLPVDTIRL